MDELIARLPELAGAHLRLALSALLLGLLFSVPLGVALHRNPALKTPALGIVGVVQTVPSLALLAFMVPAIAAVAPFIESATGYRPSAIGGGPALAALTVYGVLPILQNTVVGLGAVDPALIEAARGVGMTARQQLLKVELPLALPVIVAGVRTAAVWTIGTAVLATPVGASSLGDYIFVGLQTRNHTSIAVGCVASAGLAIVLDLWIRGVEGAAKNRQRGRLTALTVGLGAVWLSSLAPLFGPGGFGSGGQPRVRVGAKAFTEAYLFAEIFADRLRGTGLEVEQVGSLGSTVVFDALASGEIDLYLDFSGTILFNEMKADLQEGADRADVLATVRTWLAKEHDIRIAAVLGYENRYAFALLSDRADALGARRLSDLAPHHLSLSVAGSYEFFDRPEWAAVQRAYGLSFRERTPMEQALAYEAVRSGARDVVVAYSTDARIDSYGLAVLDDDRGAIPPYEAIVLVRGAFADTHREAMLALASLDGAFDEEEVRRMNHAVDQEGSSPRAAVEPWLKHHPLVRPAQ